MLSSGPVVTLQRDVRAKRGKQRLCMAWCGCRLDFATAYVLEPNLGKKDLIFRAFWILGLQIRDYGPVFVNKFIIFLKKKH